MSLLDFLNRENLEYIDGLYGQYRENPEGVEDPWLSFFLGFDVGSLGTKPDGSTPALAVQAPAPAPQLSPDKYAESAADMVHSYRELGHLQATLDPLGTQRAPSPLLALSEFGFTEADLSRPVGRGGFFGATDDTLRDLLDKLRKTYCGSLGVEYMHITDKAQRQWLQEQMEPICNTRTLPAREAQRVLFQLFEAERFETFLHTRFLGQKRFSLEGGETTVPLLNAIIEGGAELEAKEFVIGMAHRGRLSVLAHLLKKPYRTIFTEFLGTTPEEIEGEGDVKYHKGYQNTYVTTSGKQVSLRLSPNPSHLELVDPVVEGMVRAKQDRLPAEPHRAIIPILMHGEAAFTGQGIVHETLSLAQLPHYNTGGTIHVIINNQLGFTASPQETRFTDYPTEAAKLIHAPIFHVNADDVEASVQAARLAIAFRQKFNRDAVIDLWCYRKHGHNETDDPTFTSPLLYGKIAKHTPVATLFREKLKATGRVGDGDIAHMEEEIHQSLEESLTAAKQSNVQAAPGGKAVKPTPPVVQPRAVAKDTIETITQHAMEFPPGFSPHPKIKRLLATRLEMAEGKAPIDWGAAEMWALGSSLLEGISVRLAGQDSERGTFSHRHAVLHDPSNGHTYTPLAHLSERQGRLTILNSMLSELAVLGFEYGYSVASPGSLVIWEAQFGDFANGAQPIIDQFLVAGESKWQLLSGLVMLLPHGYEGQGPEHSSARLERFLQLCAENNIQVAQPSTPASYFHLLRRQAYLPSPKPLVVMTPKSLLRLPESTSALTDITEGGFRSVLDDAKADPKAVRRVVFCSGKVYFPLAEAREKAKNDDVALVRLEQLYPFPTQELYPIVKKYAKAKDFLWAQDEPRNMGPWLFVKSYEADFLPEGARIAYVGRKASASPATGYHKQHEREESDMLKKALSIEETART